MNSYLPHILAPWSEFQVIETVNPSCYPQFVKARGANQHFVVSSCIHLARATPSDESAALLKKLEVDTTSTGRLQPQPFWEQ